MRQEIPAAWDPGNGTILKAREKIPEFLHTLFQLRVHQFARVYCNVVDWWVPHLHWCFLGFSVMEESLKCIQPKNDDADLPELGGNLTSLRVPIPIALFCS
ncbi:hypothetical protein CJ030_MR1G017669 [Morella rubra]|uniref:Uncharacterized protein n=1 Tax=Morella rubra TaxID=262757 RepID=A0A6A1WLY8_9ROSI|nr:hypothetical protein CJ030_MR1G017669 [Morella rubra]